jgi:hypothetical protein
VKGTRVFAVVMLTAGLICGTGLLPAAAGDIGFKAIEGRVGFADLEGEAGSTFIVSAGADLGNLSPDLKLEGNIDFWTKGWDSEDLWGVHTTDWSYTWTMFGFIANLRYDIETQGNFHPFLFGGLGLQYWKSDVDCTGCDDWIDTSASDMEFGLNFGGGGDIGAGDGMMPTIRAGFNTNGGADYLYIQGGLKFPVGQDGQ